jgi:hypothetical protein
MARSREPANWRDIGARNHAKQKWKFLHSGLNDLRKVCAGGVDVIRTAHNAPAARL